MDEYRGGGLFCYTDVNAFYGLPLSGIYWIAHFRILPAVGFSANFNCERHASLTRVLRILLGPSKKENNRMHNMTETAMSAALQQKTGGSSIHQIHTHARREQFPALEGKDVIGTDKPVPAKTLAF